MASFIPVAAFMLARATHAPELIWLASSVGLEPRPQGIPASTLEAPLWRDSIMYIEQYGDFWDLVMNGRWIEKFCVGAAQLDQYGNANNSVIGNDYHRPKIRLPGTA
ncbi:MAG: CoA-transferase subunit beta, partial [Proteobacteria bacterium]